MPDIPVGEQTIHYIEQGSGETLLLFPDNGLGCTSYEREIEYFSARYRALSFDLPGTGQSTREVLYTDEIELDPWNFQADMACHLLAELEISSCLVMGSGLGGLAALHFAGKQARLHGIAVHGAIADSLLQDYDGRTLHRWLDTRAHYVVRRTDGMQAQHGDDWKAVVDADTAFLRRIADRGGYRLPDAVLAGIGCPVLLTGNLRDEITPGIAEQFAQMSDRISSCSVFLAAESGHRYGDQHPFMHAAPNAFRAAVDAFLEETTQSA